VGGHWTCSGLLRGRALTLEHDEPRLKAVYLIFPVRMWLFDLFHIIVLPLFPFICHRLD
jgi:hypothetical protein